MHKLLRTQSLFCYLHEECLKWNLLWKFGLDIDVVRGCIEYIPGEKFKPRLQCLIVRFNRSFDLAAMEEFLDLSAYVVLLCSLFRIRLRRWQNHASPTLVKMAERVSSSWAALYVFVLVWRALSLGIFAKVRDQPDGNLCILPFEIMTGSDRGKVCNVVIFHAQTLQAFSHLKVSILWDCRQELVTNVFFFLLQTRRVWKEVIGVFYCSFGKFEILYSCFPSPWRPLSTSAVLTFSRWPGWKKRWSILL